MKKIIAAVIALVLICLAIPFAASADGTTFWLTQYNDNGHEGAGVVFTYEDTAGEWWYHVAFKPIAGTKNAYEITQIVKAGEGYAIAIPEGGFVYAANMGNDWPTLIEQNGVKGDGATGLWYDDPEHMTMPNFISPGIANMWNELASWKVGDKFVIKGLDLENFVVATNTPTKEYYDPEYYCLVTYELYNGSNAELVDKDPDPVSEGPGEDPASEPVSEEPGEDPASEPVTESVDEPASEPVSEDVGDTSEPEPKTESDAEPAEDSAAGEASPEASAPAEDGSSFPIVPVICIAAGVIIAAVIVVIVIKKKKQ